MSGLFCIVSHQESRGLDQSSEEIRLVVNLNRTERFLSGLTNHKTLTKNWIWCFVKVAKWHCTGYHTYPETYKRCRYKLFGSTIWCNFLQRNYYNRKSLKNHGPWLCVDHSLEKKSFFTSSNSINCDSAWMSSSTRKFCSACSTNFRPRTCAHSIIGVLSLVCHFIDRLSSISISKRRLDILKK